MSDQFFLGTADHNIAAPYEVDAYAVHLDPGMTYTAFVGGASSGFGTLHDPAVLLFDPAGNLIGGQDDASAATLDPAYQFTVPAGGTYYLAVTDLYGGTGTYATFLDQVPTPPAA